MGGSTTDAYDDPHHAAAAAFVCDRHAAATQPGHHDDGHHNYQLPLLALTLVLVSGGLIQHFFSGVPLPYTVLLLLFGMALGAWVTFDPNFTLQPGMVAGEHSWGDAVLQCNVTEFMPNDLNFHGWHFGNSLRMLAEMDPHLLLHVLIPPLLFESAFALDWHIFEKVWTYAVFLAGPGLGFCTILTGLCYMGFYGWKWEAAMLVGGILSATDPVAVVALLKEMGVKKSLATLIEGESLLNDGTAVVVYSILLKATQAGGVASWLAEESTVGAWHIVWVFFRMSVLGPLMGAALGVLSCKWLEANAGADRDANVEVICTLSMPFLVFYLAETAFAPAMQMSGVLAVVSYGLVFASPYGKVRIDPHVEHFLHEFWGMVGHLVNTLIFGFAGARIVFKIDPREPTFWGDVGFGILIYVLMGLFRAVVMFGAIPYFRRGHYEYGWREALTICWGGLRGDVGLALAVAVYSDESLTTDTGMFGDGSSGKHFRQVTLIHVCLTVLCTLLINAPTSGPMLRKIGLTRLSAKRVSMLQMAHRLLLKRVHEALSSMCEHPLHSDVSWRGVAELANFDEMVSTILGQNYTFDPTSVYDPQDEKKKHEDKAANGHHGGGGSGDDKQATTSSAAGHGDHGAAAAHHHARFEAAGCRKRRTSSEAMGGSPSAAAGAGAGAGAVAVAGAPRAQLSQERAIKATKNWRFLHVKLAAFSGFAGATFVSNFQMRLQKKRETDAKYRVLEQLKMSVWEMYELGQIKPTTAQKLKELVLEQIDRLEADRSDELNPFPFGPLQCGLRFLPSTLSCIQACGVGRAIFAEFERGYDLAVGYLLAMEEVLASHDHGHAFSLDKPLDATFKRMVKQNIANALHELASLRLNWPQMCRALNTFKAARMVLNAGSSLIEELGHHGGLHETESERFLDLIAEAAAKLTTLSPIMALPKEERASFFPLAGGIGGGGGGGGGGGSAPTPQAIEAEQKGLTRRRSSTVVAKKNADEESDDEEAARPKKNESSAKVAELERALAAAKQQVSALMSVASTPATQSVLPIGHSPVPIDHMLASSDDEHPPPNGPPQPMRLRSYEQAGAARGLSPQPQSPAVSPGPPPRRARVEPRSGGPTPPPVDQFL